jgi:hypothetical protein
MFFLSKYLIVIYDLAISTDLFDEIHTTRFRTIIDRYAQELSVA